MDVIKKEYEDNAAHNSLRLFLNEMLTNLIIKYALFVTVEITTIHYNTAVQFTNGTQTVGLHLQSLESTCNLHAYITSLPFRILNPST